MIYLKNGLPSQNKIYHIQFKEWFILSTEGSSLIFVGECLPCRLFYLSTFYLFRNEINIRGRI